MKCVWLCSVVSYILDLKPTSLQLDSSDSPSHVKRHLLQTSRMTTGTNICYDLQLKFRLYEHELKQPDNDDHNIGVLYGVYRTSARSKRTF